MQEQINKNNKKLDKDRQMRVSGQEVYDSPEKFLIFQINLLQNPSEILKSYLF